MSWGGLRRKKKKKVDVQERTLEEASLRVVVCLTVLYGDGAKRVDANTTLCSSSCVISFGNAVRISVYTAFTWNGAQGE